MSSTKEPQYQGMVERERDRGLESFGLMTSYAWNDDPKRLAFTLSRYKFVAKLLSGRKHVLEIGCADAFGTRIVRQEVQKLTATDFDPVFIEDVKKRMNPQWEFDAFVHDMLSGPVPGSYDGVYALDVLRAHRTRKGTRFSYEHGQVTVCAWYCGARNAVTGIAGLRIAQFQSWSRELQIIAGFQSDDGKILPHGSYVLYERRGRAHGLP